MNEPELNWRDVIVCFVFMCLIFLAVIIAVKCDAGHNDTFNTKTNVKVDSILNTNDSIKYVIKQKDSIKYEEVLKVRNLDNDSTVELFKQLVRE